MTGACRALGHERDAAEQRVVAEVVRHGDLGAVGRADAAGPADVGVDHRQLAVVLDLGRPRRARRPVLQGDGAEGAHRHAGVAAHAVGGVHPGRRGAEAPG